MIPQKMIPPLEDFVEGHTFQGIPMVQRLDENEEGVTAPPASALTLVEMEWEKKTASGATPETYLMSTANGKITLESAQNWEFSIPKAIHGPLTAGKWEWLISTTAVDGTREPLLTGYVTVHAAP